MHYILKNLKKQDDPHSSCILDITDCERRGWICTTALLSYFLISIKEIELENVSLTDIVNLRILSYRTDCRLVVFSS